MQKYCYIHLQITFGLGLAGVEEVLLAYEALNLLTPLALGVSFFPVLSAYSHAVLLSVHAGAGTLPIQLEELRDSMGQAAITDMPEDRSLLEPTNAGERHDLG